MGYLDDIMGFMDTIFGKNKKDYAQEFKGMIENKETISDTENKKFEAFNDKWLESDPEDANLRYAYIILAHKHAAYKNFSNFDIDEVKGTIDALMENAEQLNPTNKKLVKWYKNEAKKIASQTFSLYK